MNKKPAKEKHVLRNALIQHVFELVKLNLIFFVSCLPVISIPAAIGAMTQINIQIHRGDTIYVVADYLHYFRKEFVRNTLSGLVLVAAALIFGYVFWFYQSAQTEYGLLLSLVWVMTLVPLLLCYCASCYLWVMNAVVDLPLFHRVKNAVFLTVICLKESGICLLVGVLMVLVAVYGMPYTTPFLLVFGFAFWNYTCTFYILPMVEKYVLQPNEEQKQEDAT